MSNINQNNAPSTPPQTPTKHKTERSKGPPKLETKRPKILRMSKLMNKGRGIFAKRQQELWKLQDERPLSAQDAAVKEKLEKYGIPFQMKTGCRAEANISRMPRP